MKELERVKSLISEFKAKQQERMMRQNRMRHVTVNSVDRRGTMKIDNQTRFA